VDYVVAGSTAGDGVNVGSQRPKDLCRSWLRRADSRRAQASCIAAAAVWTEDSAATH